MIIFESQGGLGNQMFQYAAARGLAWRHGTVVAADVSWHGRQVPDTTPRAFTLPSLSVKLEILRGLDAVRGRWLGSRAARIVRFPTKWRTFREAGTGYCPAVEDLPDDTYLIGYWQCPRYFDHVRALLCEEFMPRAKPSAEDDVVEKKIRSCASVFVHVRRGDYVSLAAAARFHGTCGVDYYERAFAEIKRTVREPVLFVFSDDLQWARDNLSWPAPTVYVAHNGPENAHQDLRLMASCRHAITANSSFSWWGAWLGSDPDKVVIAPRRWIAKEGDQPDRFPRSWITV